MIRSMYTAISSLHLHQYYMDVVADNLANANTNGFKSNRFTFQDQFSQIMSAGSSPTDTQGGTNPIQVGLGTRIGTSTSIFTQGALQSTGRNTDLAIEGEGLFIYDSDNGYLYSRDGMLDIDSDGYIVNSGTGLRLQGWNAAADGTLDTAGAITDLQLPLDATLARATTEATVAGNLKSTLATGSTYNATIGAYDSLGVLKSVTLTFTHSGDNTWNWAASGNGATGNGTLTFDSQGQWLSGDGSITIPGTDGAADTTVAINFESITQLATEGSVAMLNQNGLAAGSLTTFVVAQETGEVYGQFSNGMQQLMGQLALAKFVNPAGLVRVGQNLFQQGLNSGEPAIGAANTGGRGAITSQHLEGSNVDMSQEFTNMILAERGFQASSRVITTSDEMLQELVNLKR